MRTLSNGDLVVLSKLEDLFSWRFHLQENGGRSHMKRVGLFEGEDPPSNKRQKVGFDLKASESDRSSRRGEGSASREAVHILQKKKEAAEVRLKTNLF